jgi:hypothetical protein
MYQVEDVDLTENLMNRPLYSNRVTVKGQRQKLLAVFADLKVGQSVFVPAEDYEAVSVRARVCEFNKEKADRLKYLVTDQRNPKDVGRDGVRVVCIPR